MRIPKRLPTTWNVPTAAIAEPTPAASEAPHSWRMPVRSRVAQQREDRDHDHVGDDDGQARLEEDPHPVAAPDRDDPGHAARRRRRRRARARGRSPRPARMASIAVIMVAGPAPRRIATQHGGAGPGHEVGQDRAARGELVGEGREQQHERRAGRARGPGARAPAGSARSRRAGARRRATASRNQPARRATSRRASVRPNASSFAISRGVTCLPASDDDLALLDRVRRPAGRPRPPRRGRRS